VDVYIGGDEHNNLHLLYSRFIYMFLYDQGYLPKEIPEPYQKRFSHGLILSQDGSKMSKSQGKAIVPDELVDRYGADVLRAHLMFMGPFDATMPWNERPLMGLSVSWNGWRLLSMKMPTDTQTQIAGANDPSVDTAVKSVGEDIEALSSTPASPSKWKP